VNIGLLLNWGVGLEILKAVERDPAMEIGMVVTRHDPASGDRWKNAVYAYSLLQNYTTIEEESLTWADLVGWIRRLEIDLLVCHAFMKKLPKHVYQVPRLGTVNIHPSLLPKYRGPSPTFWVLKNGEKETGLTSHYVDEGLDTGPIIAQCRLPLDADDTVPTVIEKMKLRVGELIVKTLDHIRDENFRPRPQEEQSASYAPRPQKKD
jgi:methionyl-tRNA formyltransferase